MAPPDFEKKDFAPLTFHQSSKHTYHNKFLLYYSKPATLVADNITNLLDLPIKQDRQKTILYSNIFEHRSKLPLTKVSK